MKKLFFFLLFFFLLFWSFVANAQLITGVVTGFDDNLPISGALISLHGGSVQVTSGADGAFALPVSGNGLLIVAAAKGYYYQSLYADSPASSLQIVLSKVPVSDNANYLLQSPQSCGSCHPKQLDEWLDSPMAKAGFNSWVNDIYAGNGTPGGMGGFVYTRDSKFAHSNPNSECAACHQPQGWIENPYSALDANTSNPSDSVQHGVSCEVCHKVADVDESKINYPGIFSTSVVFNRPNPGEQVQYGVLGDVDYSIPGVMQASYQPQLRAELCATCHQDAADPNENHSFTGVISEPTYLEWKASSYADPASVNFKDCVDCHMLPSSDNQVCSVVSPPPRPVESVRNHRIEGTTAAFLENAVDLDVRISSNNNDLQVDVVINNNQTGHHVPTGVTVRNMILLVEAWEASSHQPLAQTNDQYVHELGGVGDPAQGYFAGMPGKLFAKVNHDESGNGPTFFTDATGIQFDNRIPANQSDQSTYAFALPDYPTEVRVRVRLIYRKAFRFLVDAKGWTEDGHGQALEDVMAPNFGHLMESYESVVMAGSHRVPLFNQLYLVVLSLLTLIVAWFVLKRRIC